MDVSTSKPVGAWQPTTMEWGTIAFEETKMRFADPIANARHPRSQAFALWALSHDPLLQGERLLSFGGSCGDDRPTGDEIDEALGALGLPPRPKSIPDPESSSSPQSTPRSSSSPQSTPKSGVNRKSSPRGSRKTGARRSGKQLSSMEKAILANFNEASRLITAYKAAKKEMEKAGKAFEKAGAELREVDRDKARLLAQFDPQAEAVLEELGVLGEYPR